MDTLIGQDHIKRRLDFYLDGKKNNCKIPPILFKGAKGLGKTEFATGFAKKVGVPFIELNCGTIRNVEAFFEQVYMPAIMDKDVTLLFDEAHKLPKGLVNVLLTVLNSGSHKKKTVEVGESRYEFDFMRQTFMFATTEYDKLFDPFKDRLTQIEFRPYTAVELGKILKLHTDWVTYKGNTLTTIAKTLRGNARAAVNTAQEILRYCDVHTISSVGAKEWRDICDTVGIRPFGLSDGEIEVLELLKGHAEGCTLTMLCAATGQSRQALQKDVELYLLRKGFMIIDVKRKLTTKGSEALKEVNKTK
jgi:Holliday junction resolvasome RuvABC ATP-dependent DNA helicase subunit|tara:strand:- start:1336 stop:2247 length:912 start_codon:yes stop_codon:yes gene_type:complete